MGVVLLKEDASKTASDYTDSERRLHRFLADYADEERVDRLRVDGRKSFNYKAYHRMLF
jgi:hypothetical protein